MGLYPVVLYHKINILLVDLISIKIILAYQVLMYEILKMMMIKMIRMIHILHHELYPQKVAIVSQQICYPHNLRLDLEVM